MHFAPLALQKGLPFFEARRICIYKQDSRVHTSSLFVFAGGSKTPLPARDRKLIVRIGLACDLQSLYTDGSPRKCLRIQALRSVCRSERGTGTRKNFHGACSVYPMLRLLSFNFDASSPLPRNLGRIDKD